MIEINNIYGCFNVHLSNNLILESTIKTAEQLIVDNYKVH